MDLLYYYRTLLKNKLIKETFWSFTAKGVALLFFILINIYLARNLGVIKFGTWSFFFSIFTIILLISYFGINASTKKYVAQYNKTRELNYIIKSAVKLRFIFSLFFVVIILIICQPMAVLLNRPEFASLFLFSAPLILLAGFVEFLKEVFIGLHRIKYNFIVTSLEYGLKLALVVLLLTFSLELVHIVNSFTIATLITSIIGFFFLYTKFYKKQQVNKEKNFTKNILRYSIPLFFITISFLLATEIDVFMIGILSNDTEVGIYAVAKQIIIKLPHISMAIAMGTMPIFAKLNEENMENLRDLFYRLLKINTLIFSVIALGILFLSWFFVPLIFGDEYTASILPLQILTVFLFCFSTSIFFSSFLDYQGMAKKRAINISIFMTLNILLNLLLIPQYGAVGAATATSVSYSPYVLLNWLDVRKVLNS